MTDAARELGEAIDDVVAENASLSIETEVMGVPATLSAEITKGEPAWWKFWEPKPRVELVAEVDGVERKTDGYNSSAAGYAVTLRGMALEAYGQQYEHPTVVGI